MNQTAIDSLGRRKRSSHLIGRIRVRGRVSARYGVSRDGETTQRRRAVGKLDFLILGGCDFERGRASNAVDGVRVLVADEAPARPANLLHVAAAVEGRDPFVAQRCRVL